MKKLFSTAAFLSVAYAVTSCLDPTLQESATPDAHHHTSARAGAAEGRTCATMDVLNEQLRADQAFARRLREVDEHARAYEAQVAANATFDGPITIPVIVNVVWTRPEENISLAQIQSQIQVLNEDFTATNPDVSKTPNLFKDRVANYDIRFTLAKVNRRYSPKRSFWSYRDDIKRAFKGGIDAEQTDKYLNIWVGNIGGGILGYAQFPGGNPATDGVVISPQYFGRVGYLDPLYNLGRTATHEVGHWLNLRHIWGDGPCGVDDFVTDTPDSDSPNYGCLPFPTVKCGNVLMSMNYMDYSNDDCMYMFTNGQKARSRALFAEGGARQGFVSGDSD